MTLADLRAQTAHMPGSTLIVVQAPWGELMPAVLLTIEDLPLSDPARDEFPPDALAIAPRA
jgi:hypothetical protein